MGRPRPVGDQFVGHAIRAIIEIVGPDGRLSTEGVGIELSGSHPLRTTNREITALLEV
jgi:hypothetical protein